MMALSTFAMAATCPLDSQTVRSCKSTPEAGDQELAAGTFDSIAICSQEGKTLMAFEKGGQQEVTEAQVQVRTGGISYSVDTKDVEFSLSVTSGIPSAATIPAHFTVNFKQASLKASSTYSCQ